MTAAAASSATVIEGEFRVVATHAVRPSPNRRRAVVRILCWNAIFVGAVIALPYVFG